MTDHEPDAVDHELLASLPPSPHPPSRGLVGWAPGAYDSFHIGHLNILRRSRMLCDYLVAGVTSDDVTLLQKGSRPLVPEGERIEIVRAMEFVNDAVLEVTSDKLVTWETVRADIVFKGDDWKDSPKWQVLEREFRRRGVRVVYLPYTDHTSSTNVRQQLGHL